MGPSHYNNFQSNLLVHEKIPASRHHFCRIDQNVVWKLNFRIGNNPPCIKKFQNFCLIFFLRKITSNSRWCRFMKNREGNWDVLLAITWVKYFVCYLWSFSQVSLKQDVFSKTSWNNFQEIWPPLNEIDLQNHHIQKL